MVVSSALLTILLLWSLVALPTTTLAVADLTTGTGSSLAVVVDGLTTAGENEDEEGAE